MEEQTVPVFLLSDNDDQGYDNRAINLSAVLTRAAALGELATVVCRHKTTNNPAVIVCAMTVNDDDTASYTPVARLFMDDVDDDTWSNYAPPSMAKAEPGPMEVFNDESES